MPATPPWSSSNTWVVTHTERSGRIEHTVRSQPLRSRQGGTLDLLHPQPGGLVGREREVEVIGAALEDARGGRSRRLLLVGEPGVGKSALLEESATLALRMTVLRATGTEAEHDLAFAALLGVLRPILDLVGELPDAQRRALEGALELGRAEHETRFAVGAATLGLVALAAERSPLLVLLDDVQWLDPASLGALSFTSARLEADAVAVVGASRPESVEHLRGSRFESLVLHPLADAEAGALLEGVAGQLAPTPRERILAEAHGNPLALVELSARLTDEQREGVEPLPYDVGGGDALARAFASGIEGLSASARLAVLAAAVAASVEPRAALDAALRELELSVDDLVPAEDAGLVSLEPGVVVFRHPLVRAAVVSAADPTERRRAHAALAASLPEGMARAHHLGEATVRQDEAVAAELERVAASASAKGAPSAAASLLVRSADLSPDAGASARRHLAAAEAAWLSGDPALARSLCERVLDSGVGDELRAAALHLRGQIAHQTEPASRARVLLVEAASLAEELDPSATVPILADAVASCMYAGDAPGALDLALRLDRCARPDGGVEEFWRCLQLGTALFLNGRGSEGAPLVHRAIELVQTVDVLRDDPRHLGSAAMAPSWVDEPQIGRALADRAIARARELGAFSSLPTSLKFGAWADFDLGRWDAALAGASEAVEIAREIGQRSQLCANLGIVAAVLAGRGDESGCLAAVSEALELADELELEWHRSSFLGWRGLLELGLGRAEQAVSSLLQAVTLLERLGNLSAAEDPFVNLVEAQIRAGLLEEARGRLQTYEAMAVAEALTVGLARSSRLSGLLAPEDGYVLHFERALELLGDGEPFTAARTHLCFGERLRRSGERRRARAELEAALETFERLGARPWAERCRQELVASGRRLRRSDVSTREELTPQELQVALQVARGLTNREVAQALFLSPKTVEFHLTRIYRKLDLHARAELLERFADQVP